LVEISSALVSPIISFFNKWKRERKGAAKLNKFYVTSKIGKEEE
jgi:hypothetical protein